MSDQQQAEVSQEHTEDTSAADKLYPEGEEQSSKPEGESQPEDSGSTDAESSSESEGKAEEGSKEEISYDLKMPENSLLSESAVDEIAQVAKEQGLSNDQAQKFLDMQSAAISDFQQRMETSHHEQVESWGEEIRADKYLGGENLGKNAELAKRAVSELVGDDFLNELDETGYGNHPKLFKLLVSVGKQMYADDLVLAGAQSNQPASMADVFYPTSKED